MAHILLVIWNVDFVYIDEKDKNRIQRKSIVLSMLCFFEWWQYVNRDLNSDERRGNYQARIED